MKNKKETILEISKNTDLLKEKSYQKLILDYMKDLDKGIIKLVSIDEQETVTFHDWVIDLMILSVKILDTPFKKIIPGSKVRALEGSIIRFGSVIESGCVVMSNSFINMGAFVGSNTMIDGGARIGTGAYIGRNTHISGGVGIGGVLEPRQKSPVMIGDNCFIGANSTLSEGVTVGDCCIIGASSVLTGSTRIYDSRLGTTKEMEKGIIPPCVVAIPATYKASSGLHRPCIEIIKDNTKKDIITKELRL